MQPVGVTDQSRITFTPRLADAHHDPTRGNTGMQAFTIRVDTVSHESARGGPSGHIHHTARSPWAGGPHRHPGRARSRLAPRRRRRGCGRRGGAGGGLRGWFHSSRSSRSIWKYSKHPSGMRSLSQRHSASSGSCRVDCVVAIGLPSNKDRLGRPKRLGDSSYRENSGQLSRLCRLGQYSASNIKLFIVADSCGEYGPGENDSK